MAPIILIGKSNYTSHIMTIDLISVDKFKIVLKGYYDFNEEQVRYGTGTVPLNDIFLMINFFLLPVP